MCSVQEYTAANNDLNADDLFDDQDDPEFTQLTEMVRNHYMNYLEKQLLENFKTCYASHEAFDDIQYFCDEEAIGAPIKQTAKLLEDKAVAACMIAQFYQKAMVKIISIVRRSTKEKRLIAQLEKIVTQPTVFEQKYCTKQTQTEEAASVVPTQVTNNVTFRKATTQDVTMQKLEKSSLDLLKDDNDDHEMTLDEKIEIFQNHLKTEHNVKAVDRPSAVFTRNNSNKASVSTKRSNHHRKATKRTHNHHHQHHQKVDRQHHRPYKENLECISPTNTIITPTPSIKSSDAHQEPPPADDAIDKVVDDLDNSNDSVALELARLFSEEKTELDEIFGIDPNDEPDDPQICKILKEIEQAKVCSKEKSPPKKTESHDSRIRSNKSHALTPVAVNLTPLKPTDLSKSLWPCELFMQRRKLSEALARLIEEDLRWHDVIKWRFSELFGEDSDDEFTPCSPSIELDETLMGSCVKRISPWVVKHLMKPMNDGLIGNRFIFKKLAKHIARSIIMENQYPDESIIKGCVENYFCLHQSVLALDALHDVPSISLF